MPAPKGNKFSPGRPKGKTNILTADVKQMILDALSKAGGVGYLVEQAEKNPNAFLTLIGKVLPKDVNVGGQDDNPLKTRMEIVIVEPDGSRRSI